MSPTLIPYPTRWNEIPGWTCPRITELYCEVAARYRSGLFVEVGVAYGCSLSFLASVADPAVRLLGVDLWQTFQGQDNLDPELFALARSHRSPIDACRSFLDATGAARAELVQGLSFDVPKWLDVQADFVFVDACHDYEPVRDDVRAWLPRLKPGGTIAGHDINAHYPGVERAVRELLPDAEIRPPGPTANGWGGVWVWRKP